MSILEYAMAKKLFGGSGGGTDDSIVGTWVFNDVLTTALVVVDTQEKFDKWNDGEYAHSLKGYVLHDGEKIYFEKFRCVLLNGTFIAWEEEVTYENEVLVYEYDFDLFYYEDGWGGIKTITITEEPSAEVANWLKANAKKQTDALAYHLTSADDLPTDAVDGSLAVVTENTTSRRFVFNDELDLSTFATNGQMFFVSCGIEYDNMNKLAQGSSSWGIYSLSYADAHNHTNLYAYTYNPTGDYGFTHGWADEAYKTVEIIYANEYVLAWIEANSTYAGTGDFVLTKTTLYSRENGKWVSKGEI